MADAIFEVRRLAEVYDPPSRPGRELTDASGELVSFRSTVAFEADGAVLTSDSTLRFGSRQGPVSP